MECLQVDNEEEEAPLLWLYVKACVFGNRIFCSGFGLSIERILRKGHFSGKIIYRETVYPQVVAYAFANLSAGHDVLDDLIGDYAVTWVHSAEWEQELQDDCFGLAVQERLPSAFLVRVMKYRLAAAKDEEDEEVVQWFGVNEVLYK